MKTSARFLRATMRDGARGGGEDEQGRGGPLRVGPHKLETLVVHLAAYQLHVDEGDVDGDIGGRRIEDLPRIVRGCYRADDLRGAGRLQELDEMVARRPLVFDDQRAQRHGKASAGISTIERVRPSSVSSRKAATPE